jgi:hypothetical protein
MNGMKLERFRDLLYACGSNPRHWPPAERRAMLALAESSPEAAAMLREARALDELLEQGSIAPAGEGLGAAIMQAARAGTDEQHPPSSGGRKPPRAANDNQLPMWKAALPLAASLMIGVWLGLSGALDGLIGIQDDTGGILEIAMPLEMEYGEGDLP